MARKRRDGWSRDDDQIMDFDPEKFQRLLSILTPRERARMEIFCGLREPATSEHIAIQRRNRQIEATALRKLRLALSKKPDKDG